MTLEETRHKLLTSDEFLQSEIKRLYVLYALKDEIRYGGSRQDAILTESVAEHIYGMSVLVEYFLPLEDRQSEWNKTRIYQMIQYHDVDEIIVGDTIGFMKTQAALANELTVGREVIAQLPESMQDELTALLEEYDAQKTPEARFVKALDKVEPLIHYYNERGKELFAQMPTKYSQHRSIKDPFVADFPIFKRFNDFVGQAMDREGFFAPE